MTLLPWLKMNVGKSGVSLTIGPKSKTLNIGSTGVNVNVSLGKGMGYSKRLITWKKLNVLSWLGLGGAAAAKKKGKKSMAPKTTTERTKVPSLDEAIAEAEAEQQKEMTADQPQDTEQQGCSCGCLLGALAVVIILVLLAVVAYLLLLRPNAEVVEGNKIAFVAAHCYSQLCLSVL